MPGSGGGRIAAIERATGRTWDEWLRFMQRIDAVHLDHHAIASQLLIELDGVVDNLGWWAQATAVAYEQHEGRRVPGQQPDGTFRLSVSKATPIAMAPLMSAWEAFARTDDAVRDLLAAEPRVSGTDRRITWRTRGAGDSTITVISEPRTPESASIVVQHNGLPSPDESARVRAIWAAVVARFLAEVTSGIKD